jgi:hypothetical protein
MNNPSYSIASSAAGFYLQHEIASANGVSHRRESAFLYEREAREMLVWLQDGKITPLLVMRSRHGYYIGRAETSTGYPMPYSRDSVEYFARKEDAQLALDSSSWTQRDHY